METTLGQIEWIYQELGVQSLYQTGSDAWIIILMRCTRMFAYSTNSLTLALFFATLEFSDFQIGLFMTLTLLGDLLLSVLLTIIADGLGRRRILFCGSFLMVLSGAAFAIFENFWVLLFAAIIGVISVTGGEFGPFRTIEESILSHLTTPKTRPDVLSWYVTTASIGSALGVEVAGQLVYYLQYKDNWSLVDAYHIIFWVYSVMGGLNMILNLLLSDKCELTHKRITTKEEEIFLDEIDEQDKRDSEEVMTITPSLMDNSNSKAPNEKKSLFTKISRSTRIIIYKLWALLFVESLADGMVGYSLTTYYIDWKFSPRKSILGSIVSASYVLSSCSCVFAGLLSKQVGLINTMVFTHLPSSTAVLLFSFPSNFILTIILFYIRTGLNNMDQAPRSTFIAAIVKPEERTAVMGITSMLRTLASSTGPIVTGILAGNNRFWVVYVIAGCLRICYDLGLWAMFVNLKLHQHEEKEKESSEEVIQDLRCGSNEQELREV